MEKIEQQFFPAESVSNMYIGIQNMFVAVKLEEKTLFDMLDKRLTSIEKKLENIESSVQFRPEIIITEQMSREEAKEKVLRFIELHGKSDIAELHATVKCDMQLLVGIIDELIAEGKIEG